jgi:hypothetical protein
MNPGISQLGLKERRPAPGTGGDPAKSEKGMAPVTAWICRVDRNALRASRRLWF